MSTGSSTATTTTSTTSATSTAKASEGQSFKLDGGPSALVGSMVIGLATLVLYLL